MDSGISTKFAKMIVAKMTAYPITEFGKDFKSATIRMPEMGFSFSLDAKSHKSDITVHVEHFLVSEHFTKSDRSLLLEAASRYMDVLREEYDRCPDRESWTLAGDALRSMHATPMVVGSVNPVTTLCRSINHKLRSLAPNDTRTISNHYTESPIIIGLPVDMEIGSIFGAKLKGIINHTGTAFDFHGLGFRNDLCKLRDNSHIELIELAMQDWIDRYNAFHGGDKEFQSKVMMARAMGFMGGVQ